MGLCKLVLFIFLMTHSLECTLFYLCNRHFNECIIIYIIIVYCHQILQNAYKLMKCKYCDIGKVFDKV